MPASMPIQQSAETRTCGCTKDVKATPPSLANAVRWSASGGAIAMPLAPFASRLPGSSHRTRSQRRAEAGEKAERRASNPRSRTPAQAVLAKAVTASAASHCAPVPPSDSAVSERTVIRGTGTIFASCAIDSATLDAAASTDPSLVRASQAKPAAAQAMLARASAIAPTEASELEVAHLSSGPSALTTRNFGGDACLAAPDPSANSQPVLPAPTLGHSFSQDS